VRRRRRQTQLQRLGDWLIGEWEQIKRRLRAAPTVHADETSWRTAGSNRWLWTACDPRRTLYHVDASRGGKVIRRLLGGAFGGTLVSDFYAAYNTVNCRQQKCLTHLLRELRETAARSPPFAAGRFYRHCKRLTRDLLDLKKRWEQLDDQAYAASAARLERRLANLADTHRRDADADARRLAERLSRHREQLTAFLWERGVDGTNNAAERALRPIVVTRKVSGGSRSPAAGAKATAVLASLLRTARQQGRDVMETLKQLLINSWAGKEPGTLLA
jgi:transposase